MTFKVTVVNKFSENVLHKGRNGAGVKAELFFSCLGVYVFGYAFAVNSWREPPLVEVVVYHGDASRATLSYLGLIRLKNRFCCDITAWLGLALLSVIVGISASVAPISRSILTAAALIPANPVRCLPLLLRENKQVFLSEYLP